MIYPFDCSMDDYLSQPYEIDATKTEKNKYRLMMDVFGEADRAIKMEGSSTEDIKLQLKTLHDVCNEVYSNKFMDNQLKHELRKKEWKLNHFLLEHEIYEDDKNDIVAWFDYWCYGIDLERLIDEEA